jgi:hypothetical protein
MQRWVGDYEWIRKHLANDWLAGTWFFLWANVLLTVGSFFLLGIALVNHDPKSTFLGASSFFNSLLFMVGSMYYVCGSYPYEGQFYYARDSSVKAATQRKRRATLSEVTADEVVVNPMAPTTIQTIEEGHANSKDSTHTALSPIQEGENECLTPKSSSDNLQDLAVKNISATQLVQPKSSTWNPLHSTPSKSNYTKFPTGNTPGSNKLARSKISAELGYDMGFD